jgi:hypothetical protein
MKKEIIDQALHCAAALLCLLPVALAPNILTGAISGLLCGLVREVTEEGDPVSLAKIKAALGSRLDLSFWALGGALAGLIA